MPIKHFISGILGPINLEFEHKATLMVKNA
jgi:hypothetical protein